MKYYKRGDDVLALEDGISPEDGWSEITEQDAIHESNKKDKENKDKNKVDIEWKQYLADEEEAKKQAWIDAGMPKYQG